MPRMTTMSELLTTPLPYSLGRSTLGNIDDFNTPGSMPGQLSCATVCPNININRRMDTGQHCVSH